MLRRTELIYLRFSIFLLIGIGYLVSYDFLQVIEFDEKTVFVEENNTGKPNWRYIDGQTNNRYKFFPFTRTII